MSAPQKAMLLAAGLGTRMRPLTLDRPKPLIAVAGRALVDHTLDWFSASGITEAVVNTHYKAEMIEAHLAGRQRPAIRISHEPDLLDTGGGIAAALPLLGSDPFVSANSDAICIDGPQPALSRLAAAWDDAQMDALLLVVEHARAIGFDGPGDFFLGEEGTLRRRGAAERAPYIFTGVQIIHPRLFAGAPAGAFSLNRLYDRGMAADGTLARVRAVAHDGPWLHVGDPGGLVLAERYFEHRVGG